MNQSVLDCPPVPSPERLRIFSLYVDAPGAGHARWINSSISQVAGQRWVTSTESWSLGSLAANASMRIMITGEAAKANVLSVTISSLGYRHHALYAWLDELAAIKPAHPERGLLLIYLGEDETPAKELEWTLTQFENVGRRMNREMSWQRAPINSVPDAGWLQRRVASFLASRRTAQNQTPLV